MIHRQQLSFSCFLSECLAENIKRLNVGIQMKEYKTIRPAMILPLGRRAGAAQLPNGMVAGAFLTRKVKGNDLMTPGFWKLMQQKMPSS